MGGGRTNDEGGRSGSFISCLSLNVTFIPFVSGFAVSFLTVVVVVSSHRCRFGGVSSPSYCMVIVFSRWFIVIGAVRLYDETVDVTVPFMCVSTCFFSSLIEQTGPFASVLSKTVLK